MLKAESEKVDIHDFAINCQQKQKQKKTNLCIFPDESKGASETDPGQKNKRRPLIPDEVMTSHMRDLDYAHKLTQFTLTCESCGDRHLIDQQVRRMRRLVTTFDKNIAEINIFQVEGVTYFGCPNKKSSVYGVVGDKCADSDTCWAPFLERKDVIVWRREHHQHRGLYAYKVKRLMTRAKSQC